MKLRALLVAAALLAIAGCKKEPPPPPEPAPVEPPAAAAPAPVEPTINAVPSASGKSDPACVGPIDLAVPSKVTIGGRKAELNGYKLTFTAAEAAAAPATFGVLGCINEDSGENMVNLKKYLDFFKAEKVQAIVVAGDTGETREAIERALKPIAESGLPVFVLIGNRECRGDYDDAMTALQKEHANLVNLNKVRQVDFGGVTLLSLPGYHDRRYIACDTGCQYFKQDVDALKPLATAAKNPVVLIAHGPPKGTAQTAIDAATEAGNVGDINLTTMVHEAGIPFGVFANIKEAGARATDLGGVNVVKEDALADQLYLNPGPADAVAWKMNDGTESVGMAAVLTVQGKQAKYKMLRMKPLSAEEKALAQKLAPPAPAPAKEEQAAAPK